MAAAEAAGAVETSQNAPNICIAVSAMPSPGRSATASAPTRGVTMDCSTSGAKQKGHENIEPQIKKQRCMLKLEKDQEDHPEPAKSRGGHPDREKQAGAHPALVPTGADNPDGWRVCVQCGVFEPFQDWTEECCMINASNPCIFPKF